MEKLELTQLIIDKLCDRKYQLEHNPGELSFGVKEVGLPSGKHNVEAKFDVSGNDFLHIVRFIIKCPVAVKGNYDKFLNAVNKINTSLSTGRYFLEGEGEDAHFCSTYETTFFNTEYERSNVDRIMMFMFDSLLLEFSNILKTI